MAAEEEWALSEEQRADTQRRIRANIASIAFFRDLHLSDEALDQASVSAERKAYTVARVEARTTTGHRPSGETLKVGWLPVGSGGWGGVG